MPASTPRPGMSSVARSRWSTHDQPAMTGGEAGGALDGIRVVDLTRALAGPYCTLMLADHGADVVKVEIPGTGDETRDWAPPSIKGVSAYYLAINRNKRSITFDLKHPDGKRVLERLIERADVVVENFSPGVMSRLGFPDDRVRSMNRRAVICHVSGFGQDGPGRVRPRRAGDGRRHEPHRSARRRSGHGRCPPGRHGGRNVRGVRDRCRARSASSDTRGPGDRRDHDRRAGRVALAAGR